MALADPVFHIDQVEARTGRNAFIVLAGLCFINMSNFMDRVLFSVMLEPMKVDLRLSDTQMGLLGGVAFAMLYGVAGLVFGRLADTRSRVKTLAGALALWSVASAACGQAQSFLQMFMARGVVGLGVSSCGPCSQSLIADAFPLERRSLVVSVFTCIGMIGTIFGLVVGGLVAQAFGWRYSFIVLSVPGILFAPLFVFIAREPGRGAFDPGPLIRRSWTESFAVVTRDTSAISVAAGIPFVTSIAGISSWLPAFLQRAHGASAAEVGTYGAASIGLGLVVGTLAGGLITNWLRKRDPLWEFRWPVYASLASVPLLAVSFMAAGSGTAYVFIFLACFVSGTGFGPAMACMMTVSDSSTRGTLVSLAVLSTSIVTYGIMPSFVGIASDVLIGIGYGEESGESLRYALMATLAFPVIAAVLFTTASKTVDKRAS